jgi:hypothetical protein
VHEQQMYVTSPKPPCVEVSFTTAELAVAQSGLDSECAAAVDVGASCGAYCCCCCYLTASIQMPVLLLLLAIACCCCCWRVPHLPPPAAAAPPSCDPTTADQDSTYKAETFQAHQIAQQKQKVKTQHFHGV